MHTLKTEQIFFELVPELRQKLGVTEKDLLIAFHRVLSGVNYLSHRNEKWLTLVNHRRIDIGDTKSSPVALALSGVSSLKEADMVNKGFIIGQNDPDWMRLALNAYWTHIVQSLQVPLVR